MVTHGVLKLRVKENWGIPHVVPEIAATDSDDEPEPDYEFVPRSETEISWASKLRKKMKDRFCFQAKGARWDGVAVAFVRPEAARRAVSEEKATT
ncbi:hypothetical protein D1007_36193 [Hordeum vulgare]|nr:hypothetical protein D1007_36193 [Hordeum vulgare]